jgi:hypothetical protein
VRRQRGQRRRRDRAQVGQGRRAVEPRRRHRQRGQRRQRQQRVAQPAQIARPGDAQRGLAGEPLEIAGGLELAAQLAAHLGGGEEVGHRVGALGDRRPIGKRI